MQARGLGLRLVIGITGATGSAIGIRLLQTLRVLGVETHLVLSKWGRATLELETSWKASEVMALADHAYGPGDQAAAISSGSYHTDGMIIAPCSMKTLAAVRAGFGDGLVHRAADVTLKERRRLVIVPRELPLSEIHLENMLALARMGTVIAPPMPAFYNRPQSVEDIVTHVVARVLDQFGLQAPDARRWAGRDHRAPSRHEEIAPLHR
ncbi:putative UbiX-like flavin prenyltransferase [Streptomyces glebosus]|uniref:Probable UbiX-like flavin prenyltransferase n=1 Tax=Streptomyces glebosus TaxID=249580 RepID=A0A640SZK9_9ACTN|nr:UbiX family flavin prenyltransferase [Streptomyces glebosus]GFE16879.1 putative UbiX-like flavin prenyltransferase [Streptomyces glebosus]GHG86551.1 putative UbiX-like flavin prenyltransferase [Streptomyces glebosus]